MSSPTPRQRFETAMHYLSVGYIRPKCNTTGAVLRDLVTLKPETIILVVRGRAMILSLEIVAELLWLAGYALRRRCPLEILIPRPGWVLLVPRHPTPRKRWRLDMNRAITITPREAA